MKYLLLFLISIPLILSASEKDKTIPICVIVSVTADNQFSIGNSYHCDDIRIQDELANVSGQILTIKSVARTNLYEKDNH